MAFALSVSCGHYQHGLLSYLVLGFYSGGHFPVKSSPSILYKTETTFSPSPVEFYFSPGH
jgi:hypothetical protein